MSMQWHPLEHGPEETIRQLSDQLTIPPVLTEILFRRGIETLDHAKYYFRAGITELHDPFLIADMQIAVDRIAQAIKADEKILVYGDYDVDGITSTSILIMFLRQLGAHADYYIPNRLEDGYGVSETGLATIKERGASLMITVDCGITAVDEVASAKALGIDVIVCDHHQAAPEQPDAVAILNPKRPGCPYPFKELAGVGVTFKLVQALAKHFDVPFEQLYPLLDLVAIGTAADIVPMIGENRILMRAGLEILNRTENCGLRALLRSTRLEDKTIKSGQIIFMLAPRLNAAGRMGAATPAVRLLISKDPREAADIANLLEQENRERRTLDDQTFREAIDMIESYFDPDNDPFFVLSSENWHPGVIGIVASRLVERYYRPTLMISTEDGVGKGSARSISGFNVYNALECCADIVLGFGGHKYAAGLSIESEEIGLLRERLHEYARENLTEDMLTRTLDVDGEIRLPEIDGKFLRVLAMMAPYGPQNGRPVFVSKGVRIVGSPNVVGKNHLRFRAAQDDTVIDAIGFNLGGLLHRLQANPNDVELAYYVEENEWQGRVSTQLRIRDIR